MAGVLRQGWEKGSWAAGLGGMAGRWLRGESGADRSVFVRVEGRR